MNYQVNYDVLPMTGQLAGRRYHKTKKFDTLQEARDFVGRKGIFQGGEPLFVDELGFYKIDDARILDLTTFLAA